MGIPVAVCCLSLNLIGKVSHLHEAVQLDSAICVTSVTLPGKKVRSGLEMAGKAVSELK